MEEDSSQQEDAVNNILFEVNNAEDVETCLQEESMQFEETTVSQTTSRPSKRGRDEDDEERWIQIGRNGKRTVQKIDLYISCSEKLPKQFALAKLLKANNIENVSRVKYINPFKVFVQFDCANSVEELINCKPLQDLGWRCQKPLEVVISYGVIKNVELDLSEKDMFDMISSNCELISVKRLKRRNKESTNNKDGKGWEPSESVRLGFKGPSLPTCVYIYGMKVNIDPYVFPVTQCSRCWRFGHSLRTCPTTKVVCPKCGKSHANCETTIFYCINCTGNHISLDRSCPAFKKEKRLRDLMAEFNCSYRKAMQIYVPPEPSTTYVEQSKPPVLPEPTCEQPEFMPATVQPLDGGSSYASVAKTVPQPAPSPSQPSLIDFTTPSKTKKRKNKKQKVNQTNIYDWDMASESEAVMNDIVDESETESHLRKEGKENRERLRSTLSFRQLLSKLYGVFSNSQQNIKSKIIQGVSIAIEWLVSIAGQYICDLPFKTLFGT